jgi:hypothetical protein
VGDLAADPDALDGRLAVVEPRTESGAFTSPLALTSLNSCAHSSLDRAGGGPGRNCDGLSIISGRITPSHGSCADWSDGAGANVHPPGDPASLLLCAEFYKTVGAAS